MTPASAASRDIASSRFAWPGSEPSTCTTHEGRPTAAPRAWEQSSPLHQCPDTQSFVHTVFGEPSPVKEWISTTWTVLRRAASEALADDIPTTAQALAYSLFLAIPATMLVALGVFSLVADAETVNSLIDRAETVMPAEAASLLQDSLRRSTENPEFRDRHDRRRPRSRTVDDDLGRDDAHEGGHARLRRRGVAKLRAQARARARHRRRARPRGDSRRRPPHPRAAHRDVDRRTPSAFRRSPPGSGGRFSGPCSSADCSSSSPSCSSWGRTSTSLRGSS